MKEVTVQIPDAKFEVGELIQFRSGAGLRVGVIISRWFEYQWQSEALEPIFWWRYSIRVNGAITVSGVHEDRILEVE